MGCGAPSKLDFYDNQAAMELMNRTVITIGKTGCGKSSMANLIMGREVFKSSNSSKSVTDACSLKTGAVQLDDEAYLFSVIDTCGFKDTGSTSDDDIVHMIRNAIQQHCKQIHMVLIVCSLGRYTAEEADVMRRVMNFLGDEMRCVSHLVFTHCEGIPFAECKQHIMAEVDSNEDLKQVAEFCEGKVTGCGTIGTDFNPIYKTEALVENVKLYQRNLRDIIPSMGSGYSVSLTKFQELEEEAKVEYIRLRILGKDVGHVNLLQPVKEDLDKKLELIKERDLEKELKACRKLLT